MPKYAFKAGLLPIKVFRYLSNVVWRDKKKRLSSSLEEVEYPGIDETFPECSTMQYEGRFDRQTCQLEQNLGDFN